MSAHDQGTDRSLEEWAREVESIFAPAVEYMLAVADAWEREMGILAAAFNGMDEDMSEPTVAKRQAVPKQHQRQAQRRMREMHSRRFQTQRG